MDALRLSESMEQWADRDTGLLQDDWRIIFVADSFHYNTINLHNKKICNNNKNF